MKKVYCSTGALIGRPNNRDYRLLEGFAGQLDCDGFEFMVYDSWYPEIERLIESVKGFKLEIPVVHCQKSLSEKLAGGAAGFENGEYFYRDLSPQEDKELFEKAVDEFRLNLRLASEFGAEKMVFHLWNGIISDRNIERNVERLGTFLEMAQKEGILLMVENVICNTHDPLYDMNLVLDSYPDACFVYDTKMAEFHGQTLDIFGPGQKRIADGRHIKHLHINDYSGGIKDWGNLKVLPIGKGHVDFDAFFDELKAYGYDGDMTVESTAFDKNGIVDLSMLNGCFAKIREYLLRM